MWMKICAAAGIAGGVLLVAYAALAAGMPEGCAGDECLMSTHRAVGDVQLLGGAGMLLILVAFAGLTGRIRAARVKSAIGRPALVAMGAGLALLAAAAVWRADSSWTLLVAPGLAACVAASAMAGVATIRSGVTPPWVGAVLVAGSLALYAANDQDERVLAVIPFALAWMVVGVSLARDYVPRRVQVQ
jgi:hypothetical protein